MIYTEKSIYTEKLAEQICDYIKEGKTLRTISEIDGMPNKSTILKWRNNNNEFKDQYTRAKEEQSEAFNEELIEIADDLTVEPDRAKLRIETRKWVMGKMKPKKYKENTSAGISEELIMLSETIRKIQGGSAGLPIKFEE